MSKFEFIKDLPLHEKLKETYNYIMFLLLLEKNDLGEDILISLNRDIIIHVNSILEGLLTYLIIEINKKWSDIEKNTILKTSLREEYIKIKSYWELNIEIGNEKVFLSKLKKTYWKINWKLNIGILIDFVKKLKVFDDSTIVTLKDIADIRNDLHIQRIIDWNSYWELTDEKMLELFGFTKDIQVKIILKLDELNK